MIKYIGSNHLLQSVHPILKQQIINAQANLLSVEFISSFDFLSKVFDDLRIKSTVSVSLKDLPVSDLANRKFSTLLDEFGTMLTEEGFPEQSIALHAVNLAQQTHLLQAFASPSEAVLYIENKVETIVNTFPKSVKDIEVGRNPGDVIDPYILAATQFLLCEGEFKGAVSAIVAHKALMIIEGLMGHLHEDIIGMMRGNVRVPEPRSTDRETIDPGHNPFPGADVMQPPFFESDTIKFHQVKSKTGSAKGGDGVRLGSQLQALQDFYGGQTYYHALIGNTLKGHRSMAAVLSKAPDTIVLVGSPSFNQLTNSEIGPELLLRVYQSAFRAVAIKSGYSLDAMTENIVASFSKRPDVQADGFLEALLKDVTQGDPNDQDSRLYVGGRKKRN
ncbi:hypothetical protein [Spirosoma utsteinense]|uniref:Uncharacterized protein n=1 Tax=Spirosoma utsteinense TaxID=2585773 RepID=A0ABR6WET5_9BACT|nr:hypothetical protein [Spirosoma utsteinense]MBC3795024.1 hypothetical protein [Spirosoma utsteinense]